MGAHGKRRIAAIGLAVALGALSIPPAGAIPHPVPPSDPTVSLQWSNPEIRTQDTNSDITSAIGEIGESTITLTLVNRSGTALDQVSVRVQRGLPIYTVAEGRDALAADQSYYDTATPFQDLQVDLAPGESHTFSIGFDRAALGMLESGVYPVMINVNGQVGAGGVTYLTSERTLVRQEDLLAPTGLGAAPTPVSMLIPVTGPVDIVPGETGEAPNNPQLILRSERLAKDIGAEGRLRNLIDEYSEHHASSCLALDPYVVTTVDRMADGYLVADERPNPVARKVRLRDSWTEKRKEVTGEPGIGSQDAQRWLDDIRATVQQGGCVVPLPRANAELGAVARTNDVGLMEEAIVTGPEALTEILGVPVEPSLVINQFGYIDQRTAAAVDTALTDPATVLVADNTIPAEVVSLSDGLNAVGFNAGLSAVLATLGDTPATAGYSNQWQRFDYSIDSAVARRTTAASALSLAVGESPNPLLIIPPSDLQAEDLSTLTEELQRLLASGQAVGMPLSQYINRPPVMPAEATGTPFEDPAVVTDTEVLRAGQQARSIADLTGLMINEPTIALTPEGFTDPLRHDILQALSANGRRTLHTYNQRIEDTDEILRKNGELLHLLRSSVNLLPPGNVYTRTSESSPLLIIAENGLPLPVDARLDFSGPEGATITVVDSLKIPARGSITAQMMANLPDTRGRTDLKVWLSSQSGAPISAAVEIGVQTRSGLVGLGGVAAVSLSVLGLLMFLIKRRNSKPS